MTPFDDMRRSYWEYEARAWSTFFAAGGRLHGPPKPAHLRPDPSWAARIDWDVLPDELQAVIDEEAERRQWEDA